MEISKDTKFQNHSALTQDQKINKKNDSMSSLWQTQDMSIIKILDWLIQIYNVIGKWK